MVRGPTNKQAMDNIFDNREILGFKGQEKIALIIKIEALFRGAIARKRVK